MYILNQLAWSNDLGEKDCVSVEHISGINTQFSSDWMRFQGS